MSETGEGKPSALAALRARIDTIDEAMHRLLMERSEVIDALIRIKGTSLPGAAFRPGREADMMRRFTARHHGALPLATVEHIWREIITTFTWMQAPFALAIEDEASGDLRDVARFYFGFSVEINVSGDAAAVVDRVAATGTDLGLIALAPKPRQGIWWRGIGGAGRPQIMAMLPFIRAAERPADKPAFVISPPLIDPEPSDYEVLATRISGPTGKLAALGAQVLAEAEENGVTEAIFAVRAGSKAGLADHAASHGIHLEETRRLGGIAEGISVGLPDAPLYRSVTSAGLLA